MSRTGIAFALRTVDIADMLGPDLGHGSQTLEVQELPKELTKPVDNGEGGFDDVAETASAYSPGTAQVSQSRSFKYVLTGLGRLQSTLLLALQRSRLSSTYSFSGVAMNSGKSVLPLISPAERGNSLLVDLIMTRCLQNLASATLQAISTFSDRSTASYLTFGSHGLHGSA